MESQTHEAKTDRIEGRNRHSTIVAEDFNIRTLLSLINRSKQKINEETEDLNNTINQLDVTDIYKTQYTSGINILLNCTQNIPQSR